MPAYQTEECDLLLMQAIERGDLDAALALYESTACFVVPPGRIVSGHAAIREVLQGFMDADTTGSIEAVTRVPSADGTIAITRTKGSTSVQGPDGRSVPNPFHSVEVVRKQPDGTWLFVIDDPTGEGLSTGAA